MILVRGRHGNQKAFKKFRSAEAKEFRIMSQKRHRGVDFRFGKTYKAGVHAK